MASSRRNDSRRVRSGSGAATMTPPTGTSTISTEPKVPNRSADVVSRCTELLVRSRARVHEAGRALHELLHEAGPGGEQNTRSGWLTLCRRDDASHQAKLGLI